MSWFGSTKAQKQLRNIDSNHKSSVQVVRELKKLRNDIKLIHEEQTSETKSVPRYLQQSPYLTDRINFDKDQIFQTEKENDWKKVESRAELEEQAQLQNEYRKKKLNIIY